MANSWTFDEFLMWERASNDTMDVKRIYIDIAGDVMAGILLSEIVYWHLPNKNGNSKLRVEKQGHMWIAVPRAKWWERIRFSPDQADYAIGKLLKQGLVVKDAFRFNGLKTVHLRLDVVRFLELLNQHLAVPKENPYRREVEQAADSEIGLGNFRDLSGNIPKPVSEKSANPLTETTTQTTPPAPPNTRSKNDPEQTAVEVYRLIRPTAVTIPNSRDREIAIRVLNSYRERFKTPAETAAELKKYSDAAEARGISPTNLCWLSEWAAAGSIPQPRPKSEKYRKGQFRTTRQSPSTEGADLQETKEKIQKALAEQLANRKD